MTANFQADDMIRLVLEYYMQYKGIQYRGDMMHAKRETNVGYCARSAESAFLYWPRWKKVFAVIVGVNHVQISECSDNRFRCLPGVLW